MARSSIYCIAVALSLVVLISNVHCHEGGEKKKYPLGPGWGHGYYGYGPYFNGLAGYFMGGDQLGGFVGGPGFYGPKNPFSQFGGFDGIVDGKHPFPGGKGPYGHKGPWLGGGFFDGLYGGGGIGAWGGGPWGFGGFGPGLYGGAPFGHGHGRGRFGSRPY